MALRFTTEVDMRVPPEAFFAAFSDVDSWLGWMNGIVNVERLTPGEFGQGTRWRETRRIFRREASEEFEVTTWDPPRAVAVFVDGRKGSTGKGEFRFRYDVEPLGEGARVRMQGEIVMPGRFSGLMARLFFGTFRKACDRDLYALKTSLEHRHGVAEAG